MKTGNGHILIVDDDEFILLSIRMLLEPHFDSVTTLDHPEKILTVLSTTQIDVIFLDMNYQSGDRSGKVGLSWIEKIYQLDPTISIVPVTAYGDVPIAVEAVRLGAVDFLIKPWQNEKLLMTALAARKLNFQRRKLDRLRVISSQPTASLDRIIGVSSAIAEVKKLIRKVAPTDASVLILGENGTGKELVAQAIHELSGRNSEPFVSVDLGAVSASLFESELFGHAKGAFTDARSERIGKIEAASGGTLFLDEIGNLPLAQQAKLLRVLQEKVVTKVGSSVSIQVDFRVVSATNMILSDMKKEGTFREDLHYRINTIEIHLPPLRERIEDIGLLARHFLALYSRKYQRTNLRLTEHLIQRLQRYQWPGNIRELQHAVERAVIMSSGEELLPSDFFFLEQEVPDSPSGSLNLEELEAWAIRTALVKHGGNVSKASEEVGITRGAMYRRMEKYGL